jgi:GNAT superfamily N-acetyltransferase
VTATTRPQPSPAAVSAGLHRHLADALGAWPPAAVLDVVASRRRVEPGWDGRVHPLLGVATPERALLSVPLAALPAVRELAARHAQAWAAGRRESAERGCLPTARTCPPGCARFGGQVLVAVDPSGTYLGGVGVRRHDAYGRELAVVTAPAARGRGRARRLVAQAARRVLADGAVPTYLHDRGNTASARVADAAGFPDRGWSAIGLTEPPRTPIPDRAPEDAP